MAPGVALKCDPAQLPDVPEGVLVAIADHGANAAPVCVGKAAMPTSQMNIEATGKAVLISHSINDSLWMAGTQPKHIPEGQRYDAHFSDSEDEGPDAKEADQSSSLPTQVDQFDVKDERDFQHAELTVSGASTYFSLPQS